MWVQETLTPEHRAPAAIRNINISTRENNRIVIITINYLL